MSFQYKIRGEQFVQFERQSQDYIEQRDQDLESSLSYDFSNLNADNLTSGTVPSARIAGSYTGITDVGTLSALNVTGIFEVSPANHTLFVSGNRVGIRNAAPVSPLDVTGTVTATLFDGSGASLTSIPAGQLTGTVASARISGSYTGITQTGTLSALDVTGTFEVSPSVNHTLYVSANRVGVRTNTPQGAFDVVGTAFATAFTAAGTVTANLFDGSGANLTSIPAGQLTGTVASARISGSYTGITGVGTLAAGSIPATLLTGTVASARISGGYTGINDVGTLTSGLSVSGNVLNSVFSINITGSGNEFVAVNPGTGSGNAAHWVFVSPNYRLYRNTSTIREKENIQSVGNLLNPNMIDEINVQLWNRKTAPGIPEVGPIAEEMDAISPFLSTRGLEWDEDGAPIPSPIDGINNNSWMSLLTIGMQDIRQRLQQLETQ